jgi:uncharacterized membrane protein
MQTQAAGLLLAAWIFLGASAAFGVVWIYRSSQSDIPSFDRRISLILRLVSLLCLILAAVGVQRVQISRAVSAVFLLDASRSITPEQKQRAETFVTKAASLRRKEDMVSVLTFAQEPEVQFGPTQAPPYSSFIHSGNTNATHIGEAMRAASALLPQDTGGKVVVISDGNETQGHALDAASTITSAGNQIDTLLLTSAKREDAHIERVAAPASVRVGEPFVLRIRSNASRPQYAQIRVSTDDRQTHTRRVFLRPQPMYHDFKLVLETGGLHRIDAILDTDAAFDKRPENNRGGTLVQVQGRPRILLVSTRLPSSQPLMNALRVHNFDVSWCAAAAMPTNTSTLQAYDAVLMVDAHSTQFSESQLSALQSAVRDFGVGFGMLGGENSFGLGGYRQTVVEEMLPVSMDVRGLQRFPPVAVAFVIDRSGSMEEQTGGRRKLDLALEGAVRAVKALKPQDKAAVVTFTGTAETLVPLTHCDRADTVSAGISGISTGGGTSVHAGVSQALAVLEKDTTPIKHMIVLTDGVSNDPDYSALMIRLRSRRITVSGVLIGGSGGSSADPGILAYLAGSTGGRFYSVSTASDLPRIYLQEMEKVSSRPIIEEPFIPSHTTEQQTILPGLPVDMPQLFGYNATRIKPSAQSVLVSPKGDPVLACRRYGLGRTFAFTSDFSNRWGAAWQRWERGSAFWAQLARWSLRTAPADDITMRLSSAGGDSLLRIETDLSRGTVMEAFLRAPNADGMHLPLPLRYTEPGVWQGIFNSEDPGTYLLRANRRGSDRSFTVGLVRAYPPEFQSLSANEALMTHLAEAGSGQILRDPEEVFGGTRPQHETAADLSSTMLCCALGCFLMDVTLRRVGTNISRLRRQQPTTLLRQDLLPQRLRNSLQQSDISSKSQTHRLSKGLANPHPVADTSDPARETPQQPPSESTSAPSPRPASADEGISRLMAAKRRAGERRGRDRR